MNKIKQFQSDTEFLTPERCHIIEMSNQPSDNACSIARARVQPGVTTQLQSLQGVAERYVILEGNGQVEIGGTSQAEVGPLDVVHIPAGVSQRIKNTSEADLIFLCICTPRFTPEVYEDLEGSKL